jgi:hypothetical protein
MEEIALSLRAKRAAKTSNKRKAHVTVATKDLE